MRDVQEHVVSDSDSGKTLKFLIKFLISVTLIHNSFFMKFEGKTTVLQWPLAA